MIDLEPWSKGTVYILPKNQFIQGTDDKGQTIDEWISYNSVVPIAQIEVSPEDFPYLDIL